MTHFNQSLSGGEWACLQRLYSNGGMIIFEYDDHPRWQNLLRLVDKGFVKREGFQVARFELTPAGYTKVQTRYLDIKSGEQP